MKTECIFFVLKKARNKAEVIFVIFLKMTFRSANILHISEFICVFIALGSRFQAVACSMF